MELGSHPDLESIPDDLASISDFVGSALKGASAPATSSPKDPSSSPAESNKALRRLLLKQMPAVAVCAAWPHRLVAAAVPMFIPYLPCDQIGLTKGLPQLVHMRWDLAAACSLVLASGFQCTFSQRPERAAHMSNMKATRPLSAPG